MVYREIIQTLARKTQEMMIYNKIVLHCVKGNVLAASMFASSQYSPKSHYAIDETGFFLVFFVILVNAQ